MIEWLSRFGAAFNVWVNGIRQANAKALAAIYLYEGTFVVWALAVLLEKPIDLAAFGLWLGFLAALGGFSYKQFKDERTTDYGYVERQNAGKPAQLPTTTTVETAGPAKTTTAPAGANDQDGGQAP